VQDITRQSADQEIYNPEYGKMQKKIALIKQMLNPHCNQKVVIS